MKDWRKEMNKWDSIVKERFENNQISKERYEEYKYRSDELRKVMRNRWNIKNV